MRSAGKRLRKSHDWLSLVFICLEKALGTRLWRSGFLLFLDRPRFCGLMKTRDRRYLQSSGMNGDEMNLENRERFSFPDASQISQCDGRRSLGTSASVGDGFRSLPIP